MVPRSNWFVRVGDMVSQGVNVFFFNGEANDSVSVRSHRESWAIERTINKIIFWEPDHCKAAHEKDLDRAEQALIDHGRLKLDANGVYCLKGK